MIRKTISSVIYHPYTRLLLDFYLNARHLVNHMAQYIIAYFTHELFLGLYYICHIA